MSKKILVTLYRNEVAPRFDLASEVLLVTVDAEGREAKRQELVLAHSSADDLCDLILDREVSVVITGGMEEEHYHYLRWKRLTVLDGVAGLAEDALARHLAGGLESGDILFPRPDFVADHVADGVAVPAAKGLADSQGGGHA